MSIFLSASLQANSEASRFAAGLQRRAKRDGSLTLKLTELVSFLAALISFLTLAIADPAQEASEGPPPPVPVVGAFSTLSHLGESDQEATLREGKLLTHQRTVDPFGITVRGSLKDSVPAVEQAATTPASTNPTTPIVPPSVNLPSLEKAIAELSIGAVNPASHQILVGSRSIREGDLLVLDSGGHQFSVWVQSVGAGGVLFCDTDLQKHILKPFGFGPKELPKNSLWEISDLRNLLDRDAKH